jgi:hypothetical protein
VPWLAGLLELNPWQPTIVARAKMTTSAFERVGRRPIGIERIEFVLFSQLQNLKC